MKRNGRDTAAATGYRFIQKDPIVDVVREAMRIKRAKPQDIEQGYGPTAKTITAWDRGKTRKPQALSVVYAMAAIGFEQVWRDGHGHTLSAKYPDAAKVRGRPRKKRRK